MKETKELISKTQKPNKNKCRTDFCPWKSQQNSEAEARMNKSYVSQILAWGQTSILENFGKAYKDI